MAYFQLPHGTNFILFKKWCIKCLREMLNKVFRSKPGLVRQYLLYLKNELIFR